ncbi:hypothetical protein [Rubrivirga sp.]|uniref:hypothetical protein n=1 Tax=Rubrivirga sp. TaxID=1885344 RepID=UPI003C742B57
MARSPLIVRRSPTGFVVRDPALEAVFGCRWLPLPFTSEADSADVLAHLRRSNPGRQIDLESRQAGAANAPDSLLPHPPSPANRQVGAASGASDIPHPSCV